jgi:hypothetical protein
MRTLVEQTRDNVFEWVVRLAFAAAPDDPRVASAGERLSAEAQQRLKQDSDELSRHTAELASAKESLLWLVEHSPIILMGGEETDRGNPWDVHPEREAILVGTQDMLLSRLRPISAANKPRPHSSVAVVSESLGGTEGAFPRLISRGSCTRARQSPG